MTELTEIRNKSDHEKYLMAKNLFPRSIILMREQDGYRTFANDAVAVAEKCGTAIVRVNRHRTTFIDKMELLVLDQKLEQSSLAMTVI